MLSKTKMIVLLSLSVLIVTAYVIYDVSKDDTQEIRQIVFSLNQPAAEVVHIEFLDHHQAVAFYEWGHMNHKYFGHVVLKKKLFGWETAGGSTGQIPEEHDLHWGYSFLANDLKNYTDLLRGKIIDPDIDEVLVVTNNGREVPAQMIEYNLNEKFWFLVTKGEKLTGSKITGYSKDGDILAQITI